MLDRIKECISDYLERNLPRSFSFAYGSYAYGINSPSSDLDFTIIAPEVSPRQREEVVRFALRLYDSLGMPIDDEVPHENKLLYSYNDLEEAVQGKGFRAANGRIVVPPVIKEVDFLRSRDISLRLLLNALTSNNILLYGDPHLHQQKRDQASKNFVQMMYSIDGVNSFTLEQFLDSIQGRNDATGELYLGYKDTPEIKAYLLRRFGEVFESLTQEGVLEKRDGHFHLVERRKLAEMLIGIKPLSPVHLE